MHKRLLSVCILPALLVGCFSEKSVPVDPQRVVRAAGCPAGNDAGTTRDWIARVHPRLKHQLPPAERDALLTEDLLDADANPIDVLARFGRTEAGNRDLFDNFDGVLHTAQASGPDSSEASEPPPWPGFEDIWIPVHGPFPFAGRIGYARRNGRVLDADCVIVLPGLLGDNAVKRTRDIALALRDAGLHALALEVPGTGRAEKRFPDQPYTFAVLDTPQVLHVAAWLQSQPHVRRTGVVGFCWGANQALLCAWADGRSDPHPSLSGRLSDILAPRPTVPVLEAGVLAFSPVLRWEEIIAACEFEWGLFDDPVLNSLAGTLRNRMIQKGYPLPRGSLRQLILNEFARSELNTLEDYYAYRSVDRLLPYDGRPDDDKLESARTPVLIVQAANDPLTSAQNVADLIAQTENPDVAAVILTGGGHVGFAPFARDYFYSLLLNFFDPDCGAAAE